MARPKEAPVKLEGKYTYCRLGDKLICFPSEVVQDDEIEVISAINHAYDRSTAMYVSKEQHKRIFKILAEQNVL